jgi:type II secretory pathway pseudopilin PulG
MNKFFKQKNKAFTLVETLIAISIFSVSLVAVMSVLGSGLFDTNSAEQKIIGTYLAQEGIEYVRNMRDASVLYDPNGAQTGWTNFTEYLIPPCNTVNGCLFNADTYNGSFSSVTFLSCGSASCPTGSLKYDSTTGKYDTSLGVDSGFVRKLQVTPVTSDEIKIISTVLWKGGTSSASVSEDLFNWVE